MIMHILLYFDILFVIKQMHNIHKAKMNNADRNDQSTVFHLLIISP